MSGIQRGNNWYTAVAPREDACTRVRRVLDEFDALDYRRKRAVSPEELVATLRAALERRDG